jgi:hypothetical protein
MAIYSIWLQMIVCGLYFGQVKEKMNTDGVCSDWSPAAQSVMYITYLPL